MAVLTAEGTILMTNTDKTSRKITYSRRTAGTLSTKMTAFLKLGKPLIMLRNETAYNIEMKYQ